MTDRQELASAGLTNEPTSTDLDRATKTLGSALVLSAIRCTLQYVVLPFVLPIFGLTGTFSTVISLAVAALAVVIILYNMIVLWPTSWRWRYMGMGAVMLLILAVFLVDDLQALL